MSQQQIQRRWELTEEERERIAETARGRFGVREAATGLLSSPRLVPTVVRSAVTGLVHGIRTNEDLAYYLGYRRVRRVVPDAAAGATWWGQEAFLEVLFPRLTSDLTALELGAGAGRISRHVAPRVRDLVCSDVSRVMLEEARENLSAHPNVRYAVTRGFTLDGFADAMFDVVYSHDVFEFFDGNSALALLDETRRVLRPGGACVISFYTMENPGWASEQLSIARRAARSGTSALRVRPWTLPQMEAMFKVVGLDVVERYFGGPVGDEGATDEAGRKLTRQELNERGRCIVVGEASS